MATNHEEAILFRRANGGVPPKAFLEKLAAKYSSCGGFMVATGGQLAGDRLPEAITADEIIELCESHKDKDILFAVAQWAGEIDIKDVQPLTAMVDDNGDDYLVVAAAGDYSKYNQPTPGDEKSKSSMSDVRAFLENTLGDRLTKLFEEAGSVEKLVHELKTNQAVANSFRTFPVDGNGTMILLFADGNAVSFISAKHYFEFEGGWTTDACGYDFQTKPAEAPGPTKKKLTLKKATAKADPASDSTTTTPDPAKASETVSDGETVVAFPPKGLDKNDDLRASYQLIIGFVPNGYKKKPGVKVKKGSKQYETAVKKGWIKDVAPHHIKAEDQQVTSSPLPVVPPAELKGILDDFLKDPEIVKLLDRNSQELAFDPETMQSLESKLPPYHQVANLPNTEATLYWSFVKRLDHLKKYPMATAVLWNDTCRLCITLLQEKYKQEELEGDLVPAPDEPEHEVKPRRLSLKK